MVTWLIETSPIKFKHVMGTTPPIRNAALSNCTNTEFHCIVSCTKLNDGWMDVEIKSLILDTGKLSN